MGTEGVLMMLQSYCTLQALCCVIHFVNGNKPGTIQRHIYTENPPFICPFQRQSNKVTLVITSALALFVLSSPARLTPTSRSHVVPTISVINKTDSKRSHKHHHKARATFYPEKKSKSYMPPAATLPLPQPRKIK